MSPAVTPVPPVREEATLREQTAQEMPACEDRDCCLVQIYPADVIDGMILMEKDTIVVGRDGQCDLHLPDNSVSRRHVEFRRVGDGYELSDLRSTNGTLVNNEPISCHLLESGDRIKIGSYIFKFLSAGCIENAYHETVYSVMTIDALTGAFNKSYMLDNLQRELSRCERHDRPMALVMMDIDKFKSVNDTYGHLVGDEVLKELGRRMGEVCREDDLFARYGGEEFAMILCETDLEDALDMAERCRHVVAVEPFETAAGPLEVTASFGVATRMDDQPETPTDLIATADERLYQAKKGGRNRVAGPDA